MKFLKINDLYIYILFILLAIVTHSPWFNFRNILTYSDWQYWPNNAAKELWNSWGSWISFYNLGAVNLQISFLPFKLLWAAIPLLGFTYDDATKITFFIPIAILGFVSPYTLIKKLTSNQLIAFTLALFYGSTPYFIIKQTGHLPIALLYAITPLIFYFFIKACESNKYIEWVKFSIIFSIAISYEVRITYIISFILFIYFMLFHLTEIWTNFKYILFSSVIILLLNSYWLLPTIFGGLTYDLQTLTDRDLFGIALFDIQHAITGIDSSWTGSQPNMEFVKQPLSFFTWSIPLLAIGILFASRKRFQVKEVKTLVFFAIITIFGIFLTKQTMSPFTRVYEWLYESFPGFSLFREASKFYLLTIFGYLGILALGLSLFSRITIDSKKSQIFYLVLILSINLISILNLKPIITGEIGTLFTSREIPADYIKLNDFVSRDNEYYRTLWFPVDSRWAYYDITHPKINASLGLREFYKSNNPDSFKNDRVTNLISDYYLDMAAVKYIIVPIADKANDDDFFKYYENRSKYIDVLNQLEYLKPVNIETKDLVIYKNLNTRPHIYISDIMETESNNSSVQLIDYQTINNTKHLIKVRGSTSAFYLNFSEAYHPSWDIIPQDSKWYSNLNRTLSFDFGSHYKTKANTNSFYIDPKLLCENINCTRDENGKYDFNIYITFKPQSYLYLGIILSAITAGACGVLLIANTIRKSIFQKQD